MRNSKGQFIKGYKPAWTAESKRKVSETAKKVGVGKWMLGRKPTAKSRQKMSENSARYWLGKKRPDISGARHWKWKPKLERVKTYGKGRKRPDTYERMRIHNPNKGKFGREHPKWREIKKHPFHKSIRELFKYRQWRSNIFLRDNYSCVICGTQKGYFQADHYPKSFAEIIRECKVQMLNDALNCLQLWDVNNGRTLCMECHKKTDNYLKK